VNEIRISGFGGQGVIRCGYIIGKTAALFDGKHATLTQSFGPEARGSACSAQIIVDDVPVRYPYLTTPDTVVCMSQEAYDKYGADITPDGTLMIDDDLVVPEGAPAGCKVYAIPGTRIAEDLGNRIAGNIVMLGFFTAVTDIISVDAARGALPSSVPSRFVELNEKAFEEGYAFGCGLVGKEPEPRSGEARESEYKPTSISRAKAGRRATTLARVNILDGKERESEEARKAWEASEKKGARLKAAERKALDKKVAAAGKKRSSGAKAEKAGGGKKTTKRAGGVKEPAKKAPSGKAGGRKKPTKKAAGKKKPTRKATSGRKAGSSARKSHKSSKKSPSKK